MSILKIFTNTFTTPKEEREALFASETSVSDIQKERFAVQLKRNY
jgi:hypothetical protein